MGNRRVWGAAAAVSIALSLLLVGWCVKPRPYYTGTNGVETLTYIAPTPPHVPVCVPDLQVPANTAAVRLQVISATRLRPALRLVLHLAGRVISSGTAPLEVPANRISNADFQIPETSARPEAEPASLCVTANALVNWGGTPLPTAGASAPTMNGVSLPARVAIWYLPRPGGQRSYLQQASAIFKRAALFRPGVVGAWVYPLLLFAILPGLAVFSVWCLARAARGRTRRLAACVFAIAAVNGCCWALITPPFQAPDEVDHFAYVQSLVERGQIPSSDAGSPLSRWSSSESLALEDMSFFTDHQVGDSRVPWLVSEENNYRLSVERLHPPANNGGGYTTSAVHGPIYYALLAPAYLATKHDSVFSQLTLMRMTSALIGALVVLFTYLLGRELAPGRPWLAVVAALLVAYEPMYGFVSGIVNNDVGVNAGAAALELLLIRLLRRGISIPWGALTGVVLVVLPNIKGTGLSLYPVAALVFLAGLWRYHSRRDMAGWAALAVVAVAVNEIMVHLLGGLRSASTSTLVGTSEIGTNVGVANVVLHHLSGYLSYLWQALLPRLPFMAPHFPAGVDPGFVIFIERGWAAFGWYDVFFPHWVYEVILVAIILTVPLLVWAARREWSWLRTHWIEALAVVAIPAAVIGGFEAAYYTPGVRPVIAEFGRYAFPGIGALALLAVGALHAFGRRRMLWVGTGVLVAMIFLSYASQLLTLTTFYA